MPDSPRLLRRVPGYPSRLGPKALATRSALISALEEELRYTAWREILVGDLARKAGCSSATFYQYFPDVCAVFRALLERLEEEGRKPSAHVQLIAYLVDYERQELGRG
jgi:AcrR family transcriptional regulator